MLKRTISYTDFNGNPQTEEAFFHMTHAELVELQFSKEGGFEEWLKEIAEKEMASEVIPIFKRVISNAYGKRSADGKRFEKSPNWADAFYQTAAYSALFMELIQDPEQLAKFMREIVPAELSEDAKKVAESRTARERSESQMRGFRQKEPENVVVVDETPVQDTPVPFPGETPNDEQYQKFLAWQASQS